MIQKAFQNGIFQKRYRRSQAEIIGITIVMVLIMLGIVFVIRFVIIPQDENIKKIYDKAQIGANFIDAMMITKTTCNSFSMREMIQNCFESQGQFSAQVVCSEDLICRNSSGCRSCDYANDTIEYMLNNTLISVDKRYDLFICEWDDINLRCMPDTIISNFQHKSCLEANKEYDAKQTPIPTTLGRRLVVQIYTC